MENTLGFISPLGFCHCLAIKETIVLHLSCKQSANFQFLPILLTNACSISQSDKKLSYRGAGKYHRNRWENPLSMLAGASIKDRATPGGVNPPIVIIVEDMAKFASPLTVQKILYYLQTRLCKYYTIYSHYVDCNNTVLNNNQI